MNYHNITKDDMLNGEGLRTVLWVAGCNHKCPGCQNPVTWDPKGGLPFDEKAKNELFSYLDCEYCSGLTLSGGDPLYPQSRWDILALLRDFRLRYLDSKTVWIYTGYRMNELLLNALNKNNPIHDILKLTDVIVDGPYLELERNTKRLWVGSDNQLIWRHNWIEGSPWLADGKEYQKSLSEEYKEDPLCNSCDS